MWCRKTHHISYLQVKLRRWMCRVALPWHDSRHRFVCLRYIQGNISIYTNGADLFSLLVMAGPGCTSHYAIIIDICPTLPRPDCSWCSLQECCKSVHGCTATCWCQWIEGNRWNRCLVQGIEFVTHSQAGWLAGLQRRIHAFHGLSLTFSMKSHFGM